MKHTFVLMVELTSKTVEFGLNIIHKLSSPPHLFTVNELLFSALSQRRKLLDPIFSKITLKMQ